MKIAVNSRLYQAQNTGIGYYIKFLYKKLLEIDHKNSYVFFQPSPDPAIGTTRSPKINWLRLPFFALLFDHLIVPRLAAKEKDITIFHGPANVLPYIKNSGVRFVLTVHDLSFAVFPEQNSLAFNAYYKFVLKRSLRHADAIVADSENTKDDLMKFYSIPSDKVDVIHLGVDEIYFDPKKKNSPINSRYFFSISTHTKRKNVIGVLEAFAQNHDLHELTCVIAGLIPKNQLDELKQKIDKLGLVNRVVLLGYVSEDDLVALYQNAEFFIYPSFYEGFGLPILEAFAAKCPVITSNNSSLVEVTPDRTWLIDPYNTQDISRKMSALVKLKPKERQQLIEKNCEFVRGFTWERCARKMMQIFEQIST